jgi:geranylgeranyl diphosphate synthase type I
MIKSRVIPTFKDLLCLLRIDDVSALRLESDLKLFQDSFNKELTSFLDGKKRSFETLAGTPIALRSVERAIAIVKAGGKRVRPFLCYLAYCTECGNDRSKALRISVALEIFHTFALVHDDIIDGGKERHGMATTHEYIEQTITSYPHGNKKNIGEAMAILVGDLFFSWSHEILVSTKNKEAYSIFLKMIEEVVAGQMLDVSLTLESEASSVVLAKKNELKTALYSFVNPMLIGSALAHSTSHTKFYRELGAVLGQAFQIQDDLLDVVGSTHETGKQTFIDIETGQHTLLSQSVFKNGTEVEKETLRAFFGKKIDDHGRKVLSNLFSSTGAILYAQDEVKALILKAEEMINNSDFRKNTKSDWISFVGLLKKRTS